MSGLGLRAIRTSVIGTIVLAALLFVPAGTLNYWQAWLFLAVWVGSSSAVTVYLAINDPALLARRMSAGPVAEQEKGQKIAAWLMIIGGFVLLVLPGFDHRFGWSSVAPYISVAGDLLIVVAFLIFLVVFRENTYGASTIQVAEGQKVISTGPYAVVRHPMYAGVVVLVVGLPLALGSWWGLVAAAILLPALIFRLLAEEQFLSRSLPGYVEYTSKTGFRLIPGVF